MKTPGEVWADVAADHEQVRPLVVDGEYLGALDRLEAVAAPIRAAEEERRQASLTGSPVDEDPVGLVRQP